MMFFRQITDSALAQNAYLIGCQRTGQAIIIDPQRDIERYLAIAAKNNLRIVAAADTHIHADFLTGVREFAVHPQTTLYLSGEGGKDWQYEWALDLPNLHLLTDGDSFQIGKVQIRALHTPGHTPEHLCFAISDHGNGVGSPVGICTGDFLFVGDVGRPDLLESAAGIPDSQIPAAKQLYESLKKFADTSPEIQIWPCHGAGSACGKSLGAVPITTAGYERRYNLSYRQACSESESYFVDYILIGQPETPPYWAEMKKLNRSGARIVGSPQMPSALSVKCVLEHLQTESASVIDTVADRSKWFAEHLSGSLYAPLGDKLSTVVGSFARLDQEVILILENKDELMEAITQLIRIGFDRIKGFILRSQLMTHELALNYHEKSNTVRFSSLNIEKLLKTGAVLLDVRSRSEHEERHIPGSLNIPYTRLACHRDELPRDQEIFVHCGSGLRASLATAYLTSRGFLAIVIDDDFSSWKKAPKSAKTAQPDKP
jgi:hydroxyacylglutathione hydrolase